MINDPEKPYLDTELNDEDCRIDLRARGFDYTNLVDIINDLVTRLAAAEREIATLKSTQIAHAGWEIGDAK